MPGALLDGNRGSLRLPLRTLYDSKKVAGVKRRVVFVEVDGEDKTTGQKSKKPGKNKSVKSQKKTKDNTDDEEDNDDDDYDDYDNDDFNDDVYDGSSEAFLNEED